MATEPKYYYPTGYDAGLGFFSDILKPISDISKKYKINQIPLTGDLGVSGTQSLLKEMSQGYSPVQVKELSGLSKATGQPFNTLFADPRLLDVVGLSTLGVGIKPSASLLGNEAIPYVNKIGTVSQRPFISPVTATEVTAPNFMQDTYRMRNTGELINNPEAMATQRQLFESAGNRLSPKYTEGQGAWTGDANTQEFNKAFVQNLPRQIGSLEKSSGLLSNIAKTGSELNQAGMGVSRFIPHVKNDYRGANAATITLPSGTKGEESVIDLYKKLGSDFAVQHRPNTNEVLIFDINNQIKGKDLADVINKVKPNAKVTYGRADNAIDKVYLTKDKWWETPADRPQGILGYEDVLSK